MGLPDQVQGLTRLAPHAYFPAPAACRPVLPVAADGDRPGGIKGLGKDGVTKRGSGHGSILHLDPLQMRPPQGKLRQIEAAQVPP